MCGKYWYAKRNKSTESLAKKICSKSEEMHLKQNLHEGLKVDREHVEQARKNLEEAKRREKEKSRAYGYGWVTRSLIRSGDYRPEGYGYRGGTCSSK